MPPVTRLLRRCFVLVSVLTLLLPCGTALAQGTSGSLPGPINSRQLTRYAERLELSTSQRLAMESAHDEYRRQFRQLREGEIAEFLRDQGSMQGGIPKREAVEELLERLEQVQAKIALLDNGLFDQLVPMLSDEQQSIVPRLRLLRERGRYEVQATQAAFGRRTADLSELFIDLELAPDDLAVADATMASYERRMTTIMRKQHKAIIRMTMDMMDELANRGYVDISQEALLEDPKLLQEIVGQIGGIYADLQGQARKLGEDTRALNAKTYRQVASVIPEAEARRFRNAYYRVSYSSLGGIVALSENAWMTKALGLETLTSEQREILEPAAIEYQGKLDRLLKQGVDRIDEFWLGFSPFEMNQQRMQGFQRDLQELMAEATKAETAVTETIDQQLGADMVAEIRGALAEMETATASAPGPAGAAATGAAPEEPAAEFAFAGDQFLPARISRRDIRLYARRMQLDEGMEDVLDELHTDYLRAVAELTVLERLREARAAVESADAETSVEERVDRVFMLRREAIEAMVAADEAFFENLRAIVGKDKEGLLDRVRRSRLRQSWAGRASERLALGRNVSNEAGVDLVAIVLEAQPPDSELDRIDDVLTDYEGQATQAFRARLDAQLVMQRMSDLWAREIETAAGEDIAAVIELQARYRETMREPTARVARTNDRIAELNRHTLEALLSALPPERAHAIRKTYDQQAFPSIYDDAASVDQHLTKAIALVDLTGTQRDQLIDLEASYRPEYERLSREMIEYVGTSAINVVGLEPEAFKQWQQRQQQFAKIGFDRNELNGRAISRLRAILTPEQVRLIGGLPEPLGEDDFYFYR